MLAGGLELVRAYERLDLERRVQLYRTPQLEGI